MKRALVLLLFVALPAFGAEKWFEAYNRGVNAVRSKNYQAAADALGGALAEMPAESGAARAGNTIITYTPHFWLGIARFNLGDLDGALREFKTSEEQGVVQNTPYYAQLREWVARANTEKQRRSENAAADSKREANAAVGRALSAQTDAVGAGADRTDAYRAAQRKLTEALDTNAKAGTDIHAYKRAADLAAQARDLFAGAAAEAKREKAARPPAVKPQPKTIEIAVPFEPPPQPVPVPVPEPQPVIESDASVTARIAAQNERRKQIEEKTKPADVGRVLNPSVAAERPPSAADGLRTRPTLALESAYRAFAAGDVRKSDELLSHILAANASAEAYLLRGCARYTQAMLSRTPEALLSAAAEDFRAALRLNRALRLDRGAFSPKLVAYFDQVRGSS
jgi:hypothetical protein